MITVTEEAKRYIRTVSAGVGLPDGLVFRLDKTRTSWYGERRLGVSVDEPREEGDQSVEHKGEDLLHISGAVSSAYDGSVVDLEETPWGTVFIFVDPPGAGATFRHQAPRTPRSLE